MVSEVDYLIATNLFWSTPLVNQSVNQKKTRCSKKHLICILLFWCINFPQPSGILFPCNKMISAVGVPKPAPFIHVQQTITTLIMSDGLLTEKKHDSIVADMGGRCLEYDTGRVLYNGSIRRFCRSRQIKCANIVRWCYLFWPNVYSSYVIRDISDSDKKWMKIWVA